VAESLRDSEIDDLVVVSVAERLTCEYKSLFLRERAIHKKSNAITIALATYCVIGRNHCGTIEWRSHQAKLPRPILSRHGSDFRLPPGYQPLVHGVNGHVAFRSAKMRSERVCTSQHCRRLAKSPLSINPKAQETNTKDAVDLREFNLKP
jgi:hypothetical protein